MAEAVATTAKQIRLIHFALFAGVFLVGVFMATMYNSVAEPPPPQPAALSLVLTGLGVLSMGISMAVLRPRFAGRASDESPDSFWGDKRRVAAAMPIWALIEGGALLGVVGYILTRTWMPLTLVPLAMILGYATRPSVLEGR